MLKILKKMRRDDNGATAIEYGLIAALLSVGIIAAVQGVRNNLNNTYATVGGEISAANTSAAAYTSTTGTAGTAN